MSTACLPEAALEFRLLTVFSGSLTFLAGLQHSPGLLDLPPLCLDPLDGEQDILLLLAPGQPDLGNQRIRREHFGDLPNKENQMNIILLLCGRAQSAFGENLG